MGLYEMENEIRRKKQQEEWYQDYREIEKTRIKSEIREDIRIRAEGIRAINQEIRAEQKRGIFEMIEITPNGEIREVTKNLIVDTMPRIVMNAKEPIGTVLIQKSNPSNRAFRLTCKVDSREAMVYFEQEEIGNSAYVLKRLAAEGIFFFQKGAKAKKTCLELMCILLNKAKVEWLEDAPGWVKREDVFFFITEDSLTWENVKEVL